MVWSLDARIPVSLLSDRGELVEALRGGAPAAILTAEPNPRVPLAGVVIQAEFSTGLVHPVGCACCVSRPAVALALDRLFQARIRGHCSWFDRILILAEQPDEQDSIRIAMGSDQILAARFRLV